MRKLFIGLVVLGIAAVAFLTVSRPSGAQDRSNVESRVKPEALRQISALADEKRARTPTQKKVDSNLLYKLKMERGQSIAAGVERLETGVEVDERGFTNVDIVADVTPNLLNELKRINAKIIVSVPELRSISAGVPLAEVENLAAMPEVTFVMPKQEAQSSGAYRKQAAENQSATNVSDVLSVNNKQPSFINRAANVRDFITTEITDAENKNSAVNSGAVSWQGDVTHQSNVFRSTTGFNGTGVKIGVISDGVNALAARQAAGELPSNVTVLSGQAGNGDEGTAMLEIVHDVAPGAQLYFATGFTSPSSFAQNIRALRTAGCTVIIDDVSYFNETAFQNGQALNVNSNTLGGVVVQAVNDVTVGNQAGALYFSSAANSGNKNDGTAGAWEGDYVDGGVAGGPFQNAGNWHNFGGQVYDVITQQGSSTTSLKWSDPMGASNNDYDLFVVNSAGTAVVASGDNTQNGTQDPYESVSNANSQGNLIVITKFSGVGRFLHLNTNRSKLSISTSGTVYGHNAGLNTISIAATPAGPATDGPTGTVGPFPNPHSSTNQVEKFSSDGPRRIFFNADSTPITPGNFGSTGGQLLAKPDLTAADGGSTATITPAGFNPFFGTSASAPNAGALAALLKSGCASATNTQIINRFRATAIDIEAPGVDRDSGAGIMMPIPAFNGLCTVAPTTRKLFDFDGDGKADLGVFRPSNGGWYIYNLANGQNLSYAFGQIGDKIVPADYDGDGKTDIAVYRNGVWYLNRSQLGFTGIAFGASTDIPAPADFDGDGKAELAVFRPSNGGWYTYNLANGTNGGVAFGQNGDRPIPADYDGDGKADYAVYRSGAWYLLRSQLGFTGVAFGDGNDLAVPADYDGDNKADVAVFRPSNGVWYLNRSQLGFTGLAFGQNGDAPTPADYDGDGKADVAVFRQGSWYLNRSTAGFTGVAFGATTDSAVSNAYVR